jgi:xylulokinase
MPYRLPVYVGVDLGTSSVKALAVDESGLVLAVEREPYPTLRRRAGWAEQRPGDWWRASVLALRRLTARSELLDRDVAALGLSGQMHGALLLDRSELPLRDAIIWADERGQVELDRISEQLSLVRFAEITGSAPYVSATLAKLLWLRAHEPHVLGQAAHLIFPKDEIRRRLTGSIATDSSDASGTLLFDAAQRTWSREMLKAAQVNEELMPEVLSSGAVAGRVSEEAAAATGLPLGLPVATGGGDAACAAYGAGVIGERGGTRVGTPVGLLSMGTAAQVMVLTKRPAIDSGGRVQTICGVGDDEWLLMGALLAGGFALEWLASATGARDAGELLDEAARVPPGAEGLVFVPHINGMRSPSMDPHARGAYVGLGASHGRGHLARAVMEGVAFALRECMQVLGEMGLAPDVLVCTGGPVSYELWQRVLADVLRVSLRVSEQEHGSALGAALLGMRSVGAAPKVRVDVSAQLVLPDEARAELYNRLFEVYRGVYPALRETTQRLSQVKGMANTDLPGGE